MDPSTTLDVKRQLIQMYITEIYDLYCHGEPSDDGADRLLSVLETYEHLLIRDQLRLATDMDEIHDMKQAINNGAELLRDLDANEPELMAEWYWGINPQNAAHGLANVLSRIILELTTVLNAFGDRYPSCRHLFVLPGNEAA